MKTEHVAGGFIIGYFRLTNTLADASGGLTWLFIIGALLYCDIGREMYYLAVR